MLHVSSWLPALLVMVMYVGDLHTGAAWASRARQQITRQKTMIEKHKTQTGSHERWGGLSVHAAVLVARPWLLSWWCHYNIHEFVEY